MPVMTAFRFDSTPHVYADPLGVWAKGERPAGTPELAMVVARTPTSAMALLFQEDPTCSLLRWEISVLHRNVKDSKDREKDAEPHVVFVQTAPDRPPVLCANDIYKMTGKVSTEFWEYLHGHFFEGVDFYTVDEDKNTRIETRTVHDPYIDGERCMTMASIWLDGKPFGISQAGGRGGRDFEARYITDPALYGEAVAYLLTLYTIEEDEDDGPGDVVDPDARIRGYNYFYCSFATFEETE